MDSSSSTGAAAWSELEALAASTANAEGLQALIQEARLLQRAERVSATCAWELDIASGELAATVEARRVGALPSRGSVSLRTALGVFAPSARRRLLKSARELVFPTAFLDLELITRDGRWLRLRARRDDVAGKARVLGSLEDVCEHHELKDELRLHQLLMNKAVEMSAIGAWAVDVSTNELFWSERVFEIHDMPVGGAPTVEEAIEFYTPESRKTIRAALEELLATGRTYDVEVPLVTATGRDIWVRAMGDVERDDQGAPVRLYGTFQDITERRAAEQDVRTREERLWLALVGSEDGVWDWNVATSEVYFSPRWKEILGHAEDELENDFDSWQRSLHPEDIETCMSRVQSALAGEIEAYQSEFRMRHRDGHWVWILARGKVVSRDSAGAPLRMVGTHTDITESIETREALVRAKEGAEAATRAKAEFLAVMSHEIRTPMNGILGMAQLLGEGDLDAQQRECAETIFRSGTSLLTILNDILDLSKIEAGRLDLEATPMDLRRSAEEVANLMRSEATANGIELHFEYDEGAPRYVLGDPVRVRQILLNLVSNAVKFTPVGEVTLRVLVTDAGSEALDVRVEVEDTGVGIAPESCAGLFQPFTQADTSTTRRFGGTGLGLTICQRLTEMMGGKIGVRSEPGRGSEFWIELRLPRAAKPENDPLAGYPRRPAPGGARRKALVVEDNRVNQVVADRMLRRLGWEPAIANDGREALERLDAESFDLVLMDCQMPEMDGFEATRRLREREARGARRHLVVAMTANALQGDREQCLQAGMDDYLSKPVVLDELCELLERLVPVEGRQFPAA